MTPSQLKHLYENNPENNGKHFFTRSTMAFFGDTMNNYGVRNVIVVEKLADNPEPFEVMELYRKKPVKHGLNGSAFFSLDGQQLNGVIATKAI